jgi:cellulose synthase operon protein C
MIRGLRFAAALLIICGLAQPAFAADRDEAEDALVAGVNALRSGNGAAAKIKLLNAIKADPAWALAHAVQGAILLSLGDGYGAEAELNRATELKIDPRTILHLRAHALLLKGDAPAALKTAQDDAIPRKFAGYAARIRAMAFEKMGDFTAAGPEYDAAIALNPKSVETWAKVAEYRYAMGNVSGAIEATVEALKINPRRVQSLRLMGIMVRGQYGLIASLPWFRSALERDPGNLDLMREFAATLGDAGQTVEMLEVTRRMIEADPTNPQAFFMQAVLAARAKNFELARALLYRTNGKLTDVPAFMLVNAGVELQLGNADTAIAQLEDLVGQQPYNLGARRLWAAALLEAGDPDATVDILRTAALRTDADSYTLTIIGRAYEQMGDLPAAYDFLARANEPFRGAAGFFDIRGDLARLSKASQGPSDNADIAVPYINRLINEGQGGQALEAAESLRGRNSGAFQAHSLVGDVLIANGNPAAATNAYRDAARINFGEDVALRLFDSLMQMGDRKGALQVLDLFLSQNPRNVNALTLAADHLSGTGQWSAAIGQLEALQVQLGSRDAAVQSSLGWAWFNQGDKAKALDHGALAYRLAPANPAVTNRYGWILFKTGSNKPQGLALLKKAVATVPEHPALRLQLGEALIAMNRKAEAKAHLQVAAGTQGFADAAKARKLLAGL